jgi:hypothetical protein
VAARERLAIEGGWGGPQSASGRYNPAVLSKLESESRKKDRPRRARARERERQRQM